MIPSVEKIQWANYRMHDHTLIKIAYNNKKRVSSKSNFKSVYSIVTLEES